MSSEDTTVDGAEFDGPDVNPGPEWLDEFEEPEREDAADQEWLREVATVETAAAIRGAGEAYDLYAGSPDKWAHLAAVFHNFGSRMLDLSQQLSTGLAAYAAANPEPADFAVGEDGAVGVLVLSDRQHVEFWEYVDEYFADPEDGDKPPTRAQLLNAYGKAFAHEYGRPGIVELVQALDDLERGGAVLVSQRLVEERGPVPTLVRVMLGGIGGDLAEDEIRRVLEEHQVVVGPPRYWPPMNNSARFLSVPNGSGIYDAYGRPVDLTAEVPDPEGHAERSM